MSTGRRSLTLNAAVGAIVCSAVRLISGATARWVGCRPSTRQRIYFANHTSHLDAVVLWSALPPPVRGITRPVAARDYWESSALKRYLARDVFNAILIARTGAAHTTRDSFRREASLAIDDVVAAMADGCSIIIFPEGTRGTGDSVRRFKGGLHRIAGRQPNAELVPVYIENLSRVLPKGEILPVPLLSSVSFGTPIRWSADESKVDFLLRARQAVEDLMH